MQELKCFHCGSDIAIKYEPYIDATLIACDNCKTGVRIKGRVGFSILEKKEKTNGVSN